MLKKFLETHSVTTHTLVMVCGALIGAFHEVPQFHAFVMYAYAHVPAPAKAMIEAFIAAAMWYWRSKKIWTPEERNQKLGG